MNTTDHTVTIDYLEATLRKRDNELRDTIRQRRNLVRTLNNLENLLLDEGNLEEAVRLLAQRRHHKTGAGYKPDHNEQTIG